MHGLNELSTYGAHPKDFDPKQVKPFLINLDSIIKWYLKYKEIGSRVLTRSAEGIRQEIKSTKEVKKRIQIPRKKLSGFFSGSIANCIVVAVFFFKYHWKGNNKTGSLKNQSQYYRLLMIVEILKMPILSDGIMGEILNNLSKLKDSAVISRTSVEQFQEYH